ncbi:MAG: type IX secretion system membrane protein PorP/SprF [Bacteroidales bacterium]
MQKHSLIAIVFFLTLSGAAFSQQQGQFSHNMFNNMGINPGLAGLRNSICATALARQQWVGFQDDEGNRLSPETYSLYADAPISFIRGGVALGFMQDQLGPETNIGVNLSYSYHHDLSIGRLGLGGRIGFLDKQIDFGSLEPLDPGDPVISGGEENHVFTDFSLGAFYLLPDEAWAGLSVSQIREASGGLADTDLALARHMYATAGYHWYLPDNPDYIVSPSILVKTDFNAMQIDINTMVTYNNRFWGGVSYRPQDAVVAMVGVKFDNISFGYSYDITTSALGSMGRSYGSHEVVLQYCFDLDIDKIQEVQRNIRFL